MADCLITRSSEHGNFINFIFIIIIIYGLSTEAFSSSDYIAARYYAGVCLEGLGNPTRYRFSRQDVNLQPPEHNMNANNSPGRSVA
jgi:hypothetical protein